MQCGDEELDLQSCLEVTFSSILQQPVAVSSLFI